MTQVNYGGVGSNLPHQTSIEGVPVTTQLRVATTLQDYLEIIKAEESCDDDRAEAVLCKHILDSRKLERNAKVRGPYQKVLTSNRKAAEDWAFNSDDTEVFTLYRDARRSGKTTEFLDKMLAEHWDDIKGVKPLPELR